MADIGIIGWGVVGKAVGIGFATQKENRIYWYDKFKRSPYSLVQVVEKSRFVFVCVPTPMLADGSGIDSSIIDGVVSEIAPYLSNTEKILILKSTIAPGTTKSLAEKHPEVNFVMNPEFLTEVNAPWDFLHPARVVIGSLNEDLANQVAKLYRSLIGYEVEIFITDPTTAELAKYMANTLNATKVIFANEFKEMADKLEINYDSVKAIAAADPRISPEFLTVTPFGGFGGKCYPKDIVALLGVAKKLKVEMSVLEAVWSKNLKIRKIKDWEKIEGAVNDAVKGGKRRSRETRRRKSSRKGR